MNIVDKAACRPAILVRCIQVPVTKRLQPDRNLRRTHFGALIKNDISDPWRDFGIVNTLLELNKNVERIPGPMRTCVLYPTLCLFHKREGQEETEFERRIRRHV